MVDVCQIVEELAVADEGFATSSSVKPAEIWVTAHTGAKLEHFRRTGVS